MGTGSLQVSRSRHNACKWLGCPVRVKRAEAERVQFVRLRDSLGADAIPDGIDEHDEWEVDSGVYDAADVDWEEVYGGCGMCAECCDDRPRPVWYNRLPDGVTFEATPVRAQVRDLSESSLLWQELQQERRAFRRFCKGASP
jgi:hypothetical protein